jgi:hypothetical protein
MRPEIEVASRGTRRGVSLSAQAGFRRAAVEQYRGAVLDLIDEIERKMRDELATL